MKKLTPVLLGLGLLVTVSGCVGLQIGGGSKHDVQTATIGQQLLDLKTAKDNGAITEAEYQNQKAKLLGQH